MPIPSITILPSFGEVLSIDEKQSDLTLLVTTDNVENTQVVSVALTSSPSLAYTGAMANNSSTITFPTADLQTLTNGKSYTITASVANIYGDSRDTSYNFTVATPGGAVGGAGSVFIRDENIPVGFVTTLNFVGLGVSADATDEIARVSIAGTVDAGEY